MMGDSTNSDSGNSDRTNHLAEELGKFLLSFSDLEGLLDYSNSMLLFRDSRHSDEARIVGAHMTYAQKVNMFEMLCNHIGLSEATNFSGTQTYIATEVTNSLRESGKVRNRFVHDEMVAFRSTDSARVFRLKRKGDPHGEGWMSYIDAEEVKLSRKTVESSRKLLMDFTVAADKVIEPRS